MPQLCYHLMTGLTPEPATCPFCWIALYNDACRVSWFKGGTPPPIPEGPRPELPMSAPMPPAPPVVPSSQGGIGTSLKELIAELGMADFGGCGGGCNSLAMQMDAWGIEGCREHREEILAQLRQHKAHMTWKQTLQAGKNAVLAGLILNPLDPAPGLLDEAIQRYEANQGGN